MVEGLPSEGVAGAVVGEVDVEDAVMQQVLRENREQSKPDEGKRRIRGRERITTAGIREPRRWLEEGFPARVPTIH